MDQKLKAVFQGIHGAVVPQFKFLNTTRRVTCMQPSTLSAFVKLVYLNLSTVVAEGHGLHWFIHDDLNSIVLSLQGTDVLPPESFKVHFTRLGAEVVNLKPLGEGRVQILYRAAGSHAVGIAITVNDQIVSESIAELTVSFVFPASAVLSGLVVGREVDLRFTEWLPGKRMRLLYRSSRDGASAASFHAACDGQGPTVTLIKSSGGFVFGGYAGVAWSSTYGRHACPSAFLFTVSNSHGDPITRFMSNGDANAVYCYSEWGPVFGGGHDLYVSDAFNGTSQTYFPNSYRDTLGHGVATFTGARNFTPAEVEVWAVE